MDLAQNCPYFMAANQAYS